MIGAAVAGAIDRRRDYWRSLAPGLSIGGACAPAPAAGSLADELPRLLADGYFATPPVFSAGATHPLATAIRGLVLSGLPPLFAMAYDEAWSLLLGAAAALAPLLGGPTRLVPDFWVWHVGRGESAGWRPHRDLQYSHEALARDGRPTLVTVWIPLTDAAPDNSCIYVLPTSRDPQLPHHPERQEVPTASLADVRALPARAGSLLGWNQRLLHWGSRSSPWATAPRVALGAYVQRADAPPVDPLEIRPGPVPFAVRLAAIGRAALRYHDAPIGDPLRFPPELLAVCRRWWAAHDPSAGR